VIGGTITSTLLTLLVIPTVYEILDDFREWAASKVGRRAAHQRPAGLPRPAEEG
jgi:HAE1 family hydrophobic/amphiphilic exporter-1